MRLLPRFPSTTVLIGALGLAVAGAAAPGAAQQAGRDAGDRSGQRAEAQPFTLVGVVLDDERGSPIAGAAVGGPDDQVVFTNAEGRFRLFDVTAGWITIQAQQLGYITLEGDVEVSPADTLEILLTPHPVAMEEIEVVVNRFERRRNAYPFPVRHLDQRDLMMSGASSLLDFVGSRAGLHTYPCRDGGRTCIWRRGGLVRPVVYVDEVRWPGGLDALRGYQPHQIYMVEVLNRGLHVRVYTRHFMERAARRGLQPLPIW